MQYQGQQRCGGVTSIVGRVKPQKGENIQQTVHSVPSVHSLSITNGWLSGMMLLHMNKYLFLFFFWCIFMHHMAMEIRKSWWYTNGLQPCQRKASFIDWEYIVSNIYENKLEFVALILLSDLCRWTIKHRLKWTAILMSTKAGCIDPVAELDPRFVRSGSLKKHSS